MKQTLQKLVLATGITILSVTGHGQIIMGLLFGDKLNSESLSFGLHMDYSWNRLSTMPEQKALTSFNLGLFFTYHINPQWHVNIEGLAKYNRGTNKLPVYYPGSDSLAMLFADGKVKRVIRYFSVPVTMQYLTRPGIFLEAGPQISLRLGAKDFFTASQDAGELQLEKNIKKDVRSIDLGWLAGVGYRIKGAKQISIGLRYWGGFSDVLKNEGGNQHHEQWGVYCNLPIGVKKQPGVKE